MNSIAEEGARVLERVRLQSDIRELAEAHLSSLEARTLTPHQMAVRLAERLVELGERNGPADF